MNLSQAVSDFSGFQITVFAMQAKSSLTRSLQCITALEREYVIDLCTVCMHECIIQYVVLNETKLVKY
jgi:hypothetical protein